MSPGPPPERPQDDIATYLRNSRTKQKASRRANPKQSAERNQAATLAYQDAQRARKQLEERARLQQVARRRLAGKGRDGVGGTNALSSSLAEESVGALEKGEGEGLAAAESEMQPPLRLGGSSWSGGDGEGDGSEESAGAGAGAVAIEVEASEGNGSLFIPMGGPARDREQSVYSNHPPVLPNQSSPVAPRQAATRRSIVPIQIPRRRDDNAAQIEKRRDGNTRDLDEMGEDMPRTRFLDIQGDQAVRPTLGFQHNQALQHNQPDHASKAFQSNHPSRATSPTFETATLTARKRKRETPSSHLSLADITSSLERLDQQHTLDLSTRDTEIIRLKMQLSDLHTLSLTSSHDLAAPPQIGETTTQILASLREELATVKREKVDHTYRISDLETALSAKTEEMEALTIWRREKQNTESQLQNLQDQLSTSQHQVSRFMDAFDREAALRRDVHAKLESRERFNVKLSKDLKRKGEEVRGMVGEREKFRRLEGAVRGLFAYVQMETMSSESFGECGRALKRVRDLVVVSEEEAGERGK